MRVAENQNTMRKHTHADIDSDGSESELEFHHTHIHNRIGTSHPLEGILTKLLSIVLKSSSPQVIFVLLKIIKGLKVEEKVQPSLNIFFTFTVRLAIYSFTIVAIADLDPTFRRKN